MGYIDDLEDLLHPAQNRAVGSSEDRESKEDTLGTVRFGRFVL